MNVANGDPFWDSISFTWPPTFLHWFFLLWPRRSQHIILGQNSLRGLPCNLANDMGLRTLWWTCAHMGATECGWRAYRCQSPNAPTPTPASQGHVGHSRATAAPPTTKAPHPPGVWSFLLVLLLTIQFRTATAQGSMEQDKPSYNSHSPGTWVHHRRGSHKRTRVQRQDLE